MCLGCVNVCVCINMYDDYVLVCTFFFFVAQTKDVTQMKRELHEMDAERAQVQKMVDLLKPAYFQVMQNEPDYVRDTGRGSAKVLTKTKSGEEEEARKLKKKDKKEKPKVKMGRKDAIMDTSMTSVHVSSVAMFAKELKKQEEAEHEREVREQKQQQLRRQVRQREIERSEVAGGVTKLKSELDEQVQQELRRRNKNKASTVVQSGRKKQQGRQRERQQQEGDKVLQAFGMGLIVPGKHEGRQKGDTKGEFQAKMASLMGNRFQ